jgi:hypothetical protein
LVERINDISGISTPRDALEEQVQAPLARACFILAKEFLDGRGGQWHDHRPNPDVSCDGAPDR